MMNSVASPGPAGSICLIGASRGLGLAMAAEFLAQGWNVVGTVCDSGRTGLHELAEQHAGRVEIAALDVTETDQIAALRQRLQGRSFDMLFHNAGTANARREDTMADVSTQEFVHVMVTNTLAPLRVIEHLHDLVRADGLIGVMSSGQGSIGNNEKGGNEIYRGSKAALNMCMRSYAARHADGRALILMAPGWIRTGLGGPNAPFSIEETIPDVVKVLLAQQGKPGLRFLDRHGQTVPW